jgi:hypothetical protein
LFCQPVYSLDLAFSRGYIHADSLLGIDVVAISPDMNLIAFKGGEWSTALQSFLPGVVSCAIKLGDFEALRQNVTIIKGKNNARK